MNLRSILGGLALAALLASPVRAQNPMGPDQSAAQGKPPPNCQAMMQMRQEHMAELQTSQAELDQLLEQLNQAGPDQEIAALKAVVQQLAQIHQQQHQLRTQMQEKMMGHMYQHMHRGRGMGAAQDCPYFQQMQSTQPNQSSPQP